MGTVLLLAGLGVVAGALTTVAGMGGGLLLLLVLSLVLDPATALAVTAPALLVGNLHRVLLCRRDVDVRIAARFSAGALPGAIVGALVAGLVPGVVVGWLMVGTTGLSVARAVGALRFRMPVRALSGAGLAIGALTGGAGGAGMLAAPLLLATGLTAEAYVGTSAACAAAMHVGRLAGYGAAGLFTGERLIIAGILTLAILAGNQLGWRTHRWTRRLPAGLIEHTVLAVSVVLALVGVGRA